MRYARAIAALEVRATGLGFRVERTWDTHRWGIAHGATHPSEKIIWVSMQLKPSETVMIMAHEVGHAEQWDHGKGCCKWARAHVDARYLLQVERGAWVRAGRMLRKLQLDLPWHKKMDECLASCRLMNR